mmetsp:Transcript_57749/g.78732  ORF Transcript_57749/g.78732 Transcript_57749/m.78732 type:complete len:213 (+) Transcript_57749:323-961(+)
MVALPASRHGRSPLKTRWFMSSDPEACSKGSRKLQQTQASIPSPKMSHFMGSLISATLLVEYPPFPPKAFASRALATSPTACGSLVLARLNRIASGGMKPGVPISFSQRYPRGPRFVIFAMPKSQSLIWRSPSSPSERSTLAGFRSRWTICSPWMYARVCASSSTRRWASAHPRPGGRESETASSLFTKVSRHNGIYSMTRTRWPSKDLERP